MQIKPEEITQLLEFFSKNSIYRAKDSKAQNVMSRCLDLFSLDYNYLVIPNTNGELSSNYPSKIVILETEKVSPASSNKRGALNNGDLSSSVSSSFSHSSNVNSSKFACSPNFTSLNTIQENFLELPKLKELCSRARFARCRARFPVPVILYNKKYICRSATLSGGPEIYGRSSLDYFFSGGTDFTKIESSPDEEFFAAETTQTQSDWQLFDRVRSQDIRLLKTFQIQTIVDLMVEKKKVKFGVNVTSSEKVDKENRYADFNLISLPYPGCEFFKQYRDHGYNGSGIFFEWNQGHVDANISIPDPWASSLNIKWSQYRTWDLVTLTQNYLKLLLVQLKEGHGLLVHCISGWDRTPLFISLLRLSLWADGAIHKTLDAEQILYLTLAYDWFLFGHNLEDRLSKGEEILFFCFYFLKHIVGSEFSIEEKQETPKTHQLTRVRNDSDIQLDGILLDGELSHTSPDGSNWSLNSCSSSQSNKSHESQPPTYFLCHEDGVNENPSISWEDCNGPQNLLNMQMSNNHLNLNNHYVAQVPNQNTLTQTNNITSSSQSPVNQQSNSLVNKNNCNNNSLYENNNVNNSQPQTPQNKNSSITFSNGRTSPVAVPTNSRVLHPHNNYRPESNSSNSIGSWQLITGTGSLRETISTSEPGSGSISSHQSRLPMKDSLEYVEASESSCTLVEELTLNEFKKLSLNQDEDLTLNSEPNGGATPEPKNSENLEIFPPTEDNVFSNSSSCNGFQSTSSTSDAEKTKENNKPSISKRQQRLQTVRATFYSLYSSSIGFQFKSINENIGSGGGLGFISNFANKVGIRVNRNNV